MRTSTFLSIAASLSSVSGTVYTGFNYGSTFTDGSAKAQSDFQAEFTTAKNLVGTSGAFTSARLYTMIVCLSLSIQHRELVVCRQGSII
jgi:glucan endo-1,3-beta-D-glucosidase